MVKGGIMLSKEEFVKYINRMKDANQCELDILEASRPWVKKGVLFEYVSVGTGYLAESMIDLMTKLMDLPDNEDIISYWCWELEFGEKWTERCIEDRKLPECHKYRNPVLKTVDELYDYCVFLSEEYSKEKKE